MGLEKYESKQVRILQPAELIYNTLSDFTNFTPILQDKLEQWSATCDTCSFKVKGFTAKLRIVEREPWSVIKVSAEQGAPIDFKFWLQLAQVAGSGTPDSRMRLVLHVELNMMLKMMIGSKIQQALDQVADQIAASFNQQATTQP